MSAFYYAASSWHRRRHLSSPSASAVSLSASATSLDAAEEVPAVSEVDEPVELTGADSEPESSARTPRRKRKSKSARKNSRSVTISDAPAEVLGAELPSDIALAAPSPVASATASPAPSSPRSIASAAQDGARVVGRMHITSSVLGTGSFGTVVFAGHFEGRRVAVKRLVKQFLGANSADQVAC